MVDRLDNISVEQNAGASAGSSAGTNAGAGAGVNLGAGERENASAGKQTSASAGKRVEVSAGKRVLATIQVASKTVNLFVLALVVAAVAIAIYALTDINSVVVNGAPEQYEIYKPGEEQKSFEELIVINPEVIGWIQVYGTKIDYPVTQAINNDRYLSYGPDLKYSLLGSIFLDCNNAPDFSDFNSILYGHNMTPRAMFGNIKDFKDKAYFEAHRENLQALSNGFASNVQAP